MLHPEQVTEYQYGGLLPEDLDQRIEAWEEASGVSYQYELSVANGWKVGGWANWNLTDPYSMACGDCGQDMDLLLRIDSAEWDGTGSWRPLEDVSTAGPAPHKPTQVTIGRGYSLWIFTCPASFDHPHKMSMQLTHPHPLRPGPAAGNPRQARTARCESGTGLLQATHTPALIQSPDPARSPPPTRKPVAPPAASRTWPPHWSVPGT